MDRLSQIETDIKLKQRQNEIDNKEFYLGLDDYSKTLMAKLKYN